MANKVNIMVIMYANCTIKLKDKKYTTVIMPTMTYGAECWADSKVFSYIMAESGGSCASISSVESRSCFVQTHEINMW